MASDDDKISSHDEERPTDFGGLLDPFWRKHLMQSRSEHDQDLSEIRDRYLALDADNRVVFRRMIEGIEEHAKMLQRLGFSPGCVLIHFGPKLDRTGWIEIIAGLVAEQLDVWDAAES